jgi:hypothetical protein
MQHNESHRNQSPPLQHSMASLGADFHDEPANTPQYKAITERLFRFVSDAETRQS